MLPDVKLHRCLLVRKGIGVAPIGGCPLSALRRRKYLDAMATGAPATDGWVTYMDAITRRATGVAVARATGVDATTISKWRNAQTGRGPTFDQVIAITRAYGRSPLEGFVQAGLLTPDEIDVRVVKARVEDLTPLELAEALHERLLEERDAELAVVHGLPEPDFDDEDGEAVARTIEPGDLPGVDPQESA